MTGPWTAVYNTPNRSPRQNVARRGAVLHHAAMTSLSGLRDMEVNGTKQVSSTAICKDNNLELIIPDPNMRAWSLADAYWDSALHSIECCNESTNGWTISDASHESLARAVAYWASTEGWRPHRDGDPTTWTVLGHREINSIHGGSYSTACPGGMDLDRVTRRAQQLLAGGFAGGGITVLVTLSSEQYKGENAPQGANIFAYVDWTLTAVKNLAKVVAGIATTDAKILQRTEEINGKRETDLAKQNGVLAGHDAKLDAISAAIKSGVPVTVKVDESFADLVAAKVAAKIPAAASPDEVRSIVQSELATLVLAPRA